MNLSLTEKNIIKLWGEQKDSWDYLEIKLANDKLQPGVKYRFEGWMMVSSTDHPVYAPFFKVVFNNKDEKLLKKQYTHKYDMLDINTWQKFTTEFELTDDEFDGKLLLNKGSNTPINIVLYIKNISLHKITEFTKVERQTFDKLRNNLPNNFQNHPRLFVNDEKIHFIANNLKREPYVKFWNFVQHKAIQYSKEKPPVNIDGFSDPKCMLLGDKLPYIAFAYLLTGDNNYLQSAIKWMDRICTYENWSDNKDIGAAHILQGLAISYDWLYDNLPTKTREICLQKIILQADILYMSLVKHEKWWATDYLQNHNYVNVMSIAIAGLSILNEEEKAESWIMAAKENFQKVLSLLSPDGGSHEGIHYWGYGTDALLKYFIGLSPIFGEKDLLANHFFQNTAQFRLYSSLPDYKDNVDYADSPRFEAYGSGHILRALACLFHDGNAQWLANRIENARGKNASYNWLDLIWYDETILPEPPDQLPTSHYFDNLGIFIYRSDWSENSTWIFFKAGPPQGHLAYKKGFYTGSHIHPDEGNFLLWAEGKWLIMDDGYVYRKMSSNHNVLLINGYGQLGEGGQWFNEESVGRFNGKAEVTFSDIKKNYTYITARLDKIYPPEAGIKLWERTFILLPYNNFLIRDEVQLLQNGKINNLIHFPDGILEKNDNCVTFQKNNTNLLIAMFSNNSIQNEISTYFLPKNEILNLNYCNCHGLLFNNSVIESKHIIITYIFSISDINIINILPSITNDHSSSTVHIEFNNFSSDINYIKKMVAVTNK